MSGTDASGQQMTYAQPTEQPNQRAENGACRCDMMMMMIIIIITGKMGKNTILKT